MKERQKNRVYFECGSHFPNLDQFYIRGGYYKGRTEIRDSHIDMFSHIPVV